MQKNYRLTWMTAGTAGGYGPVFGWCEEKWLPRNYLRHWPAAAIWQQGQVPFKSKLICHRR